VDQQERAIDDLTRVLTINPDHVNAAFARAACYNKIGQFVKAIEDYNFALMKDESNTDDANAGTDAALSQQGDEYSTGGLDHSRLAYQNDGDASPVLGAAARRLYGSSDSAAGDISPLSTRSSGKFSNYHQYSPVSTPVQGAGAPWGRSRDSYAYGNTTVNGGSVNSRIAHEGWAATAATGSFSVNGAVSAGNSVVGAAAGNGSVVSGSQARTTPRPSTAPPNTGLFSSSSSNNNAASTSTGSLPNAALADEHHSRGYLLRKANDFAGAVAEYTKVGAAGCRRSLHCAYACMVGTPRVA
jgi:tetratricopeptide (TPR) repeat protein